jgi:hypothetical protein
MLLTSWLPDEKYTYFPSGDHPVTSSTASSKVRRVSSPRASVSTYTSPLPVRDEVKASRLPSGE